MEKDREEYFADLEARKQRAAESLARRPAHAPKDPSETRVELSAIDDVLNSLHDADVDFQETHGKPNQPLIDETIENNRLRQLLAESDARLATIKAKGDSVQRLRDAIGRAENRLQSLLSKAETEEIARLAAEHYGWNIPWKRISEENKRDFRNHASVIALKSSTSPLRVVQPGQSVPVEQLKAPLQRVGESLAALREHLSL
jgi:hypothetical protein